MTKNALAWTQLPPLPDREGFAAPFAGVSNGALVVAGGANFADKRPWEGGTKSWYDHVFVLEAPGSAWKSAGRLPRPIAYGVSATARDGVVCAGGGDRERHFSEVFLLQWTSGAITIKPLAPLPRPCANASGALLGDTLYLAGGIETPTSTTALRTFWALDVSRADAAWRQLEPWPGSARMLAVAGAHDGSFFLFSGAELHASAEGQPVRAYLRDAYRFTPGQGWKRCADLPRPAVAAPSPAMNAPASRLLVIGGDDGAHVHLQPPIDHPGFPRDVLAYDAVSDTWRRVGEVPFSLVTAAATMWREKLVIPGGEERPGARSPRVWAGELTSGKGR